MGLRVKSKRGTIDLRNEELKAKANEQPTLRGEQKKPKPKNRNRKTEPRNLLTSLIFLKIRFGELNRKNFAVSVLVRPFEIRQIKIFS